MLKRAGVTMDQFLKMTPAQRVNLDFGPGHWSDGWMGDTHIESHPEMSDVTVGFRKNPQPAPEHEDAEDRIAREDREQAAQDPFIQDLARRLNVPVHFLLDFRERAIGQFGPRL
jgi:hypothetical protein